MRPPPQYKTHLVSPFGVRGGLYWGCTYLSMANTVLKFNVSKEHLLAYFENVCKLAEKQEQFPVNLDDVWPLIYGRKEEAVRALTTDFQYSEDVDYKVLRRNAENPTGGRPVNEYWLSVSCLEHFVARKKRDVFEVYRKVFHKTKEILSRQQIRSTPQTYAQALRQLADEVEAKEKVQLLLAEKTQQLDESKEWFSIKRWAKQHSKNWRDYSWRKLKAVSYELGYEVKKIFDSNFEQVNIYHRCVFEAVYGK